MTTKKGMLPSQKRKWLHAGLVATVSVLTDIGLQLVNFGNVEPSRTVIVGLIIGGFARIAGAVIATWTVDNS